MAPPSSPQPESASAPPTEPVSAAPKPSKFRFKKPHHQRSTGSRSRSPSPNQAEESRSRRHRHRSRRSRRHHDDDDASPQRTTPPPSPDKAFRESLFDALADEEGAAYWEGVYGQPIHGYSRLKTASGADGSAAHDERGNPVLEQMADDEYAAYVRAKMWEKSHQHISEERERRARERDRVRERERERERLKEGVRNEEAQRREKAQQYDFVFDVAEMVEEREKKGDNGRSRSVRRWARYLEAWNQVIGAAAEETDGDVGPKKARKVKIPWPTSSGRVEDLRDGAVEEFLKDGAQVATGSTNQSSDAAMLAVLKVERVRWHPDKVAQRVGRRGLSEAEVKGVTATFQVVDRLYAKCVARGQS